MTKAARFNPVMDLDLFHLLIENSNRSTVLSDPELMADGFGPNFAISACHFDVAIPVHTAPGFLEARKERPSGACR
jgi:hypothetical protein